MSELNQSKLMFKNPIIEKVFFEKNQDYNSEQKVVNFFPEANMNVQFIDDNRAIASFTFSIGERKDCNPYFSFKATASSEFKWKNLTKEKAKEQLKVSGPTLLVSYIRPLLANLTSQAGLPPYHLPFIDFTNDSEN